MAQFRVIHSIIQRYVALALSLLDSSGEASCACVGMSKNGGGGHGIESSIPSSYTAFWMHKCTLHAGKHSMTFILSTYQPQDTDSDDEAWLRTDIPDPRQKHSNKRTPAVLLNGPVDPLDTHTQPPHKRPCTSQHICATLEPQWHTVPDGHTTDPSSDAEANGDSSLRRVS